MAKITARRWYGGTPCEMHEVARYKNSGSGTQYLVRSDGVVLEKFGIKGSGWKVEPYMTQTLKRGYRDAQDRVAGAIRWLDGTPDLVRVK